MSSRNLEFSNTQYQTLLNKFNTQYATLLEKFNGLSMKVDELSTRPHAAAIVHNPTAQTAAIPQLTIPSDTNTASATVPAANPDVQVVSSIADKLADLISHKDREDPPLFDGRESFTHFLSTFEDFLADWKIPAEKWKHLLCKSLR